MNTPDKPAEPRVIPIAVAAAAQPVPDSPTAAMIRTLGLVSAICGLIIVGAYQSTFDAVAANKRIATERAVFKVIPAAQLLLKLGADVNAVDANGETAMHGAAYKNLPRVVQFLADHGARKRSMVRCDGSASEPRRRLPGTRTSLALVLRAGTACAARPLRSCGRSLCKPRARNRT